MKTYELTLEEANEMMSKNNGNLDLSYWKIGDMPEELHVPGDLVITNATIDHMSSQLTVDGNMEAGGADILNWDKSDVTVKGYLYACRSKITEFPETLTVGGDLDMSESELKDAETYDLTVGGNINLSNTAIDRIPYSIEEVNGNLDICGTKIDYIGALKIHGNLCACNAPIRGIEKGLTVDGNLDLGCSEDLEEIPAISVGGWLGLYTSTGIKKIAEGLTVGGDLDLDDSELADFIHDGEYELPKNIKVGGKVKAFCSWCSHEEDTDFEWPPKVN